MPADANKPELTVSLTRKADPESGILAKRDVNSLVAIVDNAKYKYATAFEAFKANTGSENPLKNLTYALSIPGITKRAPSGTVPLTDQSDQLLWTGALAYGTPGQTFSVSCTGTSPSPSRATG